jgi:hypothetical protein
MLIEPIWYDCDSSELSSKIIDRDTHQNHVCNAKKTTSYPTEAQENTCQETSHLNVQNKKGLKLKRTKHAQHQLYD